MLRRGDTEEWVLLAGFAAQPVKPPVGPTPMDLCGVVDGVLPTLVCYNA